MTVYLFYQKPISFQLRSVRENVGLSVVGDVEVRAGINDLDFTCSSGEDASKVWPMLDKLLSMSRDGDNNSLKIHFSSTGAGENVCNNSLPSKLHVRIKGKLLQQVRDLFGNQVRVKLEIGKAQNSAGVRVPLAIGNNLYTTTEMWITSTLGIGHGLKVGASTEFIDTPVGWMTRWRDWFPSRTPSGMMFTAEASLVVSVMQPLTPSGDLNIGCWRTTTDPSHTNKRLLHEEIRSDVEIIAGNGIGVKCHSAHLAVHSEVLKAMLDSGLEESRTNKIPMPDVSEEVVRAFLAFLYYQDLSKPLESCSVAVELLQMGHKYMVECLENEIKSILLSKPDTWFDVCSTLSLFFFAGKLDNQQDLRLKAVHVLKSKPSEVLASAEYQRLFQVEDTASKDGGQLECLNCNEYRTQFQALQELFKAFLTSS